MVNVVHSTLTGSNLHEPKGADAASLGQVYVSDGSGSGTWTTVTGLVFTGMVADFLAPLAPTGWLEMDGSVVTSAAYPALYDTITIQRAGTRIGGLSIISGLSSTTGIKAGYYVTGTGFSSVIGATTVVSVDSSTQVTVSASALSSGTSTVIFSPWGITPTSFSLPVVTDSGKFRRSRTSSVQMGQYQASQNQTHDHTGSTGGGGSHSHTITVDSGGVDHTHLANAPSSTTGQFVGPISANNGWSGPPGNGTATGTASAYLHTHTASADTVGGHTHPISASGGSEARPHSIVLMTCVKT